VVVEILPKNPVHRGHRVTDRQAALSDWLHPQPLIHWDPGTAPEGDAKDLSSMKSTKRESNFACHPTVARKI
jgi:hypothetical protein